MARTVTVTRTRSRDSRVNSYHTIFERNWQGTITHNNEKELTGYTGALDTISDVPHKGFRQLIASGTVVLGDMLWSRRNRQITSEGYHVVTLGNFPQYLAVHSGDLVYMLEACLPMPSSALQPDLDRMGSVALTRAIAKLKQPSVMGGELISDLDKSLDMLRRPFQGSTKLLGKMMKYRAKRLGKTTASAMKASANAWLEYRYGWRPLISDMQTIIEEVHGFHGKLNGWRLVARSEERSTRTRVYNVVQGPGPPGYSSWRVTGTLRAVETARACAGVIYDLRNRSSAEQILKTLGFRPADIPATVWEVIPYSFVVDWFVNVGDWIQAIVPVPGLNVLGSWITTIQNMVGTYSDCTLEVSVNDPSQRWIRGNGGSSVHTADEITRYCNPSLPSTPVSTVNFLSTNRVADALSLSVSPILKTLSNFKH